MLIEDGRSVKCRVKMTFGFVRLKAHVAMDPERDGLVRCVRDPKCLYNSC